MQSGTTIFSSHEYPREAKKIAEGTYGKVYLAKDPRGKTIVVKKINDLFQDPRFARGIFREIKFLRLLKEHPNIVSLEHVISPKESQKDFDSLSLVFEKMDTDLAKLFASEQKFTDLHNEYFLYHLLCGVRYIHSAGIVHRDLKPANILVNSNCDLKICDFNLSRKIDLPSGATTNLGVPPPLALRRQLTPHVVTRAYRAPEVMMQRKGNYGLAVDMWSIGCIFAELLMMQTDKKNRKLFFGGDSCFPLSADSKKFERSPRDQLNVIFDCLGTPTDEDIASIAPDDETLRYLKKLTPKPAKDLETLFPYIKNKQAIDFLKRCLVINPNKRITVEEALKDPFFNRVRNDKEKLTFQLSSLSKSDREFLDEYDQFEIEFDSKKNVKMTSG